MATEIERKWMARKGGSFMELSDMPSSDIIQFYTKITEEEEIRYRTKRTVSNITCYKTIKKGNGLSREEEEFPITEQEFNNGMKEAVKGSSIIIKKRIELSNENVTCEIDCYKQPSLDGKVIIEIEFKDEETARAFKFPKEFIPKYFNNVVDITSDKRYKNKNIALNGFPNN